jgi:AcrR family transcriptional regulator
MEVNRRTQADRSAATRGALVAAARRLFAERSFAGVGTEAIVREAGLTRGALYHQFADKTELFAAVFEAVEADTTRRIAERIAGAAVTDPLEAMALGAEAWLDACRQPEVQQIVLLDAPAVLGWERWRAIGQQHAMALVVGTLTAAVEAGRIPDQPVLPLAHLLIGALDEAALYVARAADQEQARDEVQAVVGRLIAGLARPA